MDSRGGFHHFGNGGFSVKVEYRKEPVRPDENIELKVSYEAEESGRFSKVITVYANVKSSPVRLRIMGDVENL